MCNSEGKSKQLTTLERMRVTISPAELKADSRRECKSWIKSNETCLFSRLKT